LRKIIKKVRGKDCTQKQAWYALLDDGACGFSRHPGLQPTQQAPWRIKGAGVMPAPFRLKFAPNLVGHHHLELGLRVVKVERAAGGDELYPAQAVAARQAQSTPIFFRNGSMDRGRPRNFSIEMLASRELPTA
jgi:hypothetical protein